MASISESEKGLVWICGEKTGEDVMSTTWKMKVSGHRKVGITKLRCRYVYKKDTKETGVQREDPQYRRTWTMKYSRHRLQIVKCRTEEE